MRHWHTHRDVHTHDHPGGDRKHEHPNYRIEQRPDSFSRMIDQAGQRLSGEITPLEAVRSKDGAL